MRHVAGLFAGIIIAPLAWLLIGAGTIGLDPNGLHPDVAGKPDAAISTVMFLGAGILLGLLAVTRVSPVGPATVAVIFGAAFALYRFTPFHFDLPVALEAAKVPGNASAVAGESGLVLVIAALLLMSVLVPSRWRGKDDESDRELIDTAALAGSDLPKQPDGTTTANIDPFPPTGTGGDPGTLGSPVADGRTGNGYDNTTTPQPFGSPTRAPEPQRSPYADDGYGTADGYDYDQQQYGTGGRDQQYR